MRLKENEKQVIIQAVKSIDPQAHLYLFGSRVDDSRKGGDIDILIFSDKMNYDNKLNIKKDIFTVIEEQKIDLFVSKDRDEPFVQMVLEQGIQLA
ncbi:MAG: nucleotidyltransferase domain-containing protein [Nitrospirota bacterium]